jgi:hypothetical protein
MVRAFLDPDSCASIEPSRLPFSSDDNGYRYVAGDALQLPVTVVGRPVWVSLSGGANGAVGKKKLFRRAVVQQVVVDDVKEEGGDDEDHLHRVRVEYASGSTYKVRPSLLEGILSAEVQCTMKNQQDSGCHDQNNKHVLLYRETDAYRRACVIHCGIAEDFLEIGCAEGITCEKIRQTTGGVDGDDPTRRRSRPPVGIDKSATCIDEARKRYPECEFVQADIFAAEDNCSKSDGFCWRAFAPTVVAIDINGTRELEAVLSSIDLVIRHWQPRLVLVKSRALYHAVQKITKMERTDDDAAAAAAGREPDSSVG